MFAGSCGHAAWDRAAAGAVPASGPLHRCSCRGAGTAEAPAGIARHPGLPGDWRCLDWQAGLRLLGCRRHLGPSILWGPGGNGRATTDVIGGLGRRQRAMQHPPPGLQLVPEHLPAHKRLLDLPGRLHGGTQSP
ncbi:UNVERIFIED_CONTAM: hypothetical protein K2H54_008790 [Gekko kuhli]